MIYKNKLNAIFFLFAFLAVMAGYYFYHTGYSFRLNAEKVTETAEAMRERAAAFDQASVLAGLSPNALNDFYYRLDEALSRARFESLSGVRDVGRSYIFGLEFDGQDDFFFKSRQGAVTLENGYLKTGPTQKETLETSGTVSIPTADVSKIVIRAKALKDNLLWIGLSDDPAVERTDLARMQLCPFDIIPDGNFHVYEMPVRNLLHGRMLATYIRKMFLTPAPNVVEDYVEIDYLRFVSAKGEYQQEQYGVTCEKGENLLQQAVFMTTPAQLSYRLTLPDKKCRLSFSTKILEDNDIVTFSVSVKQGDQAEEIFFHQVNSAGRWQDALLDLSSYAGATVDLVFQAVSQGGNIAFWGNPIIYSRPERRFNIVLVLEDALRADHMSCYGYGRKTTPVKDKWKDTGVMFLNAFAQATVTGPSVRSLMTALYPTTTGAWGYEKLHENFLTLAEVLRDQGFITASFLQNPNAGAAAGLHQGFSQVIDPAFGRADEVYNKTVPSWMRRYGDRNFFVYLHLIDPHGVFDPPEEFRKWYDDRSQDKGERVQPSGLFDPYWVKTPTTEGRRALYDGEIRFNDHYFGAFLDQIREMGLLEDTLIFFVSDHGEHLGEHDEWGHHPPGYVQAIKTPLIAVYPRLFPKGRQLPQLVQNIDIMPTIFDLLGIDTSGMLMQGRSLLPLILNTAADDWDDRIVFSDEVVSRRSKDDMRPMGSVFFRSKHIVNSPEIGLKRFDLGADAAEVRPEWLFDKEKKLYRKLIRQVQQNNAGLGDMITKGDVDTVDFDPETMNRLKQLGYLDGNVSPPRRKELKTAPGTTGRKDGGQLFYNNLERYMNVKSRFSPTTAAAEYHRIRSRIELIYQQADEARQIVFYPLLNTVPVSEVINWLEVYDRQGFMRHLMDMTERGSDSKGKFYGRLERYIMSDGQVESTLNRKRFETICSVIDAFFPAFPDSCQQRMLNHLEFIPIDYIVFLLENTDQEKLKQMMASVCF